MYKPLCASPHAGARARAAFNSPGLSGESAKGRSQARDVLHGCVIGRLHESVKACYMHVLVERGKKEVKEQEEDE